MTESMKYYESIRRKYPEAVSKDQFYQIAHILYHKADREASVCFFLCNFARR